MTDTNLNSKTTNNGVASGTVSGASFNANYIGTTSPYTTYPLTYQSITTSSKNNRELALDQAIVLMRMHDVGIISIKDLIRAAKVLERYLDGN